MYVYIISYIYIIRINLLNFWINYKIVCCVKMMCFCLQFSIIMSFVINEPFVLLKMFIVNDRKSKYCNIICISNSKIELCNISNV